MTLLFGEVYGIGDAVTNLREEIIDYRIKASLELEDKTRQVNKNLSRSDMFADVFLSAYSLAPFFSSFGELKTMLDKASQALEKYFFLISFAAFVEDSDGLSGKFADWLKVSVFFESRFV